MATLRRASLTATVQPKATTKAEATTDITIKPSVKAKLLKYLANYASAHAEGKAAKAAKDDATFLIRLERERLGVNSLEIDGYKMTDVPGTQFDREATYKKLMSRFDLTIEDIKSCEVYKPKKAFEKITCPGDSDE